MRLRKGAIENKFESIFLWSNSKYFRKAEGIMSLYSKLKAKVQEELVTIERKKGKHKPSNVIVEHIVSLSGQEIQKVYTKYGFLGRGGFANCYITKKADSDRFMATKVIEKSNLKSNRTRLRLMNEIKIHKHLKHPNIVEFYHNFEDHDNVYIMLELCENQSLSELIKQRGTFTWPEVQSFTYGICQGVKYLHDKKFIHRDLKLGNIFLSEKYEIKIGDFGLTSQLEFLKENKRTVCGTPNYIAPEVLEGTGYYFQIDVWAIGIIIYTLFFGYPPFQSENTPVIYQKIRECNYQIPKKPQIPIQALHLIRSILIPEPLKRPSIDDIMNSSFMRMGRGPLLELPESIYYQPPTKKELENLPFAEMRYQTLNEVSQNIFCQTKAEREKSTFDKTHSQEPQGSNKLSAIEDLDQNCNSIGLMSDQLNTKPSFNENEIGCEDMPEVYVLELDTVSENVYYYRTSQQIMGIYEKDRQNSYRHFSDFSNNSIGINIIPLFDNLFGDKSVVPFTDFKHKAILAFKSKEVQKELMQKKGHREGYNFDAYNKEHCKKYYSISKINQHKDVTLVRLSNKSIQIIFQDLKDGFIYETKSESLFYFNEKLLKSHKKSAIKPVIVPSLMSTVKNFLEQTKHSSKVPNLLTCLALKQNEPVKIPILKIKYVYGLMGELKNKKTRHGARNSQ